MKTASDYRAIARTALAGNWNKAAGFMLLLMLLALAFNVPSSFSSIFHWSPWLTLSLSGSQFFVTLLLIAPLQYAFNIVCMLLTRGIQPAESMTASVWELTKQSYSKIVCGILLLVGVILAVCLLIGLAGVILIAKGHAVMAAAIIGLLFAAAFVVNYMYCLFPYILVDEPELGIVDTFRRSRELMDGHIFSMFLLDLSFIGWAILALMTGGLGLLWLQPYMSTARGAYYQDIIAEQ